MNNIKKISIFTLCLAIATMDTIAVSAAPRGRNARSGRRAAARSIRSAAGNSSLTTAPVANTVAPVAATTEPVPSVASVVTNAMASTSGEAQNISVNKDLKYTILLASDSLKQVAYIRDGVLFVTETHPKDATNANSANQTINLSKDGKIIDSETDSLLGFIQGGAVYGNGKELEKAKESQIDLTKLAEAVGEAKKSCSGIHSEMKELLTSLGITTTSSSIGIAASGVALASGLGKMGLDKFQEKKDEQAKKELNEYNNAKEKTNKDTKTLEEKTGLNQNAQKKRDEANTKKTEADTKKTEYDRAVENTQAKQTAYDAAKAALDADSENQEKKQAEQAAQTALNEAKNNEASAKAEWEKAVAAADKAEREAADAEIAANNANGITLGSTEADMQTREKAYGKFTNTKAFADLSGKAGGIAGTVRTVALGASTATSAVSTATSAVSIDKAKKLIEKMEKCNEALKNVRLAYADVNAEIESLPDADKYVYKEPIPAAKKIIENCADFNKSNMDNVKNKMVGSTVVSAIGIAAGATGTVSSAIAGSSRKKADEIVTQHANGQLTGIGVDKNGNAVDYAKEQEALKKKEKTTDLIANISAGVSLGTSGTSTILSALSSKETKEDLDKAEKCESAL